MKQNRLIMMIAAALLPLMTLGASELTPKNVTVGMGALGERGFVHPLRFVNISFSDRVKVSDCAVSMVYGDETLLFATGFEVNNYEGADWKEGIVTIWFDETLLPLDRDYKFSLNAGAVESENDSEAKSPEVEVVFNVPADLGEHHCDIEPNSVVASARSIWVYWGYETDPVGEPEWTLYREDVEVEKYPAHVGWDWDLGQAYVDFGSEMTFDRDVHYSLVLPAGSVSSCYRADIVNREVRIDFVGGYEPAPEPPLTYDWCSIYVDHPDGQLDKVWFRYSRPVSVAEGGKVLLYQTDPEILVAEADAFVDTSINCFCVCADFQGFPLEPMQGYCFVIPEGTVIAEDGSGAVNPRQTSGFSGTSGIESVETRDEKISLDSEAPLYDIYGRRVTTPQPGSVYIRNGRKFVAR